MARLGGIDFLTVEMMKMSFGVRVGVGHGVLVPSWDYLVVCEKVRVFPILGFGHAFGRLGDSPPWV